MDSGEVLPLLEKAHLTPLFPSSASIKNKGADAYEKEKKQAKIRTIELG
jgi:hypothetical protein